MHYYERNIVEIRNEYTTFFINMVAPLIYEGMKSIYMRSLDLEKQYEEASMKTPAIKSPGILKIFQHFLKGIPNLNVNLIESEMVRIRDSSKNADIFEKLIKAVIKSNIILLTYNASGKECKLVNEKFHDKIDIKSFIHKIYIECAIQFYNNPEIFWHKYSPIELQKNQKEAINIIKECIREGIIKILPLNEILNEYLNNDYIKDEEVHANEKVRRMLLDEDKHINLYNEDLPIIDPQDNGEEESNKLFRELNQNITNMDELILNKGSDEHYSNKKEHYSHERMNTEEEYKTRMNKDGYTFDLLNRNKSRGKIGGGKQDNKEDNREKTKEEYKYNKEDNKILEDSDNFNVEKPKIVEKDIGKINPKEYYNAMFI